jgi:hypothetical protein
MVSLKALDWFTTISLLLQVHLFFRACIPSLVTWMSMSQHVTAGVQLQAHGQAGFHIVLFDQNWNDVLFLDHMVSSNDYAVYIFHHRRPSLVSWAHFVTARAILKLCTYASLGQLTSQTNFGPIWFLAWPPGGQTPKHKKWYFFLINGWIISNTNVNYAHQGPCPKKSIQ